MALTHIHHLMTHTIPKIHSFIQARRAWVAVRGIDRIDPKLLINVSASYVLANGLHISATGKNVLNNGQREFFRTDRVPFTFMAGVNYEF
ncbi:MAG: hypothetical protein H7Y42_14545 [Chitinophagaceae bacterium]|nr:hypothetical protein [Chitinophagaceae bacterium]